MIPTRPLPDPGYVLVIDQTRGDASVRASGGDRARFLEMLLCARKENPDARILVKTHPETVHGFRAGHFTSADAQGPVEIYDRNIAPMALLEGATRVYTLSSQMGFEAIIAGHRPRVFGTPFYAGWGLSDDETALPRRGRGLTSAQLFLAAMIYFPVWFDPYLGKRCELETVLAALEAQTRAWRADFRGWTAYGIRLWKRGFFQHYFGAQKRLIFAKDLRTPATGRPVMVWGNRPAPTSGPVTRVEDGFIRSRGLGAKLVPPVSLITDEEGIYFDPRTPSALEKAIIRCATEQNSEHELRAEKIAHMIRQAHLTKYNMEGQGSGIAGRAEDPRHRPGRK